MVLLTMTSTIVAAVEKYNQVQSASNDASPIASEPSLEAPKIGNPISHSQLIDLSKQLRAHQVDADGEKGHVPSYLNDLLKGSNIYVAPPKPKPEPTPEYKALMARLRAEEERREYDRLLNPPSQENFTQSFSASKNPFKVATTPTYHDDYAEDEVTYQDVDRQLTLILNILVSIIACSVGIWVIARYWDTPARLFISMGGGGLVGVAEVVIYLGYLRRIKEAKIKEKKIVEKKEVLDSWVIEGKGKKTITGAEVLGADPRDIKKRIGKGK